MKPSLLRYLACPSDMSSLSLYRFDAVDGVEIESGMLCCTQCGARFFIVDFIPRLLGPDLYDASAFERRFSEEIEAVLSGEAPPEGPASNPVTGADTLQKRETSDVFGYEWSRWDGHGIREDDFDASFSHNQFTMKTMLGRDDLDGRLTLDAGCGNGRYMLQALEQGAEVIGIDLSQAVESAFHNTRGYDRAHVVQTDIFNLPFRPETFDIAFSIGVLHHTPDTKQAFVNVARLVKPEGTFSVCLYHKGNVVWEWIDAKLRERTVPMDRDELLPICERMAKVARLLDKLYMLAPANLFLRLKPNTSILYDWYSPPTAWHHTYPEVYGWYEECGMEVVGDYGINKKRTGNRLRNSGWIKRYIAPLTIVALKGRRT